MIRQVQSDLEAELNTKYPGRKVWAEGGAIVIHIPMAFKKRGGRKEIISPGSPWGLPEGAYATEPPNPQPQRPLVVALAKAHRWQKMVEDGEVSSIKELARRNRVNPSYIARILRLATLAPDIVEAIVDGREPSGLSLRKLTGNLPLLWDEQQEQLSFPLG
jgi:hypothetical protein